MRKRHQQPKPELLVNVTHCHIGCDGESKGPSDVHYFSGDWLRYTCEIGYRTQQDIDNHKGSYAICDENGDWIYKRCKKRRYCNNQNQIIFLSSVTYNFINTKKVLNLIAQHP